jgi:hypothetical protein
VQGAKTKDTDWYKEILVPAKQHAKVNPTLVPVSVFEDYAQLAFKVCLTISLFVCLLLY